MIKHERNKETVDIPSAVDRYFDTSLRAPNGVETFATTKPLIVASLSERLHIPEKRATSVAGLLAQKGVYDYIYRKNDQGEEEISAAGYDFTSVLAKNEAGAILHELHLNDERTHGSAIDDKTIRAAGGIAMVNESTGETAKYGDSFAELPQTVKAEYLHAVWRALVFEKRYRAEKGDMTSAPIIPGDIDSVPSYHDIQQALIAQQKDERRATRREWRQKLLARAAVKLQRIRTAQRRET